MKRTSSRVFVLSLLTGAVITLFQAFWLYQNFRSGSQNFVVSASNMLQKSINAYQLKHNAAMLNIGSKDSAMLLYVNASAKQITGPKGWRQVTSGLSPANMQNMRTLMAGMLGQVTNTPFAMREIGDMYRRQLAQQGMPTDVGFTVYPDSTYLQSGQVSAMLGLSSNSPVVVASFNGAGRYLLNINAVPLTVSALLLLVTFACLRYMQTVIKEQQRLDGLKNDFINNMAHEFRTPVTILKSTHEALVDFNGVEDKEKTLRYLHANEAVLKKMENDIERVLTIAPFEKNSLTPNYEAVNPHVLLTDVLAPCRLLANANFTIENNISTLQTDKYMLGVILANLVDNAIKYGGTSIAITLTHGHGSANWQLCVQDNGCGIATEHLPYIFDKFYRAPQGNRHDTKGFGLGLSYVKELTAMLKGTAKAESKPGQGAKFILDFAWIK